MLPLAAFYFGGQNVLKSWKGEVRTVKESLCNVKTTTRRGLHSSGTEGAVKPWLVDWAERSFNCPLESERDFDNFPAQSGNGKVK